jgi:hypothetical protein
MSACYIEYRSKAVVSAKAHSPSELTSPNRNVSITRSVLISYVAYYPPTFTDDSPNAQVFRQCKSNFDEFLIRTTTNEPLIHFVFSLVGDTPISEMLSKATETQKNVEIIHAENRQIDLFAHAQQISRYIDQKEFFVLLNCGARGPYYSFKRNPPTPNLLWLIRFISPLKGDVKMAGTTISCEAAPHVQSYAMSVDAVGAKILIDLWQTVSSDTNSASKRRQIAMFEVGASRAILSKGYNIASLDSRYAGRDFRNRGVKCDPEFSGRLHPMHLNPTVCRTHKHLIIPPSGCRGIEPCEVVFVKYGGEALNYSLIPATTTNRLDIEDNRKRICKDSWRPFAPYWDVQNILDGLLRDNYLRHLGRNIATSEMVFLVRAHKGYAAQLESMLQFLQTIQSCTISVIVIPTEKGSFASLNDGLKAFSTKSTSPSLSILDVPDSLYDQYGAYIESLCTAEQRQGIQIHGYAKESIDHMCRVNSPLNNLLSDLMLEYIKRDAASSQWLIVTDVGNSYSPEFFTFVSSARDKADIALVNMIDWGKFVNSSAKASHVEPGSFAVSIPFLRKSGATFLSSIPLRPAAHHYHDADGHFIKALLTQGARAIKTEAILLTRNSEMSVLKSP